MHTEQSVAVLIIEDDENDIELMKTILPRRIAELANADFEVEHVHGVVSTELINAKIRGLGERLRLVICDGLNGQIETVIRAIKGSFPKLAVIAASSDRICLALGMTAGASAAIDKADIYTTTTAHNIIRRLLVPSV